MGLSAPWLAAAMALGTWWAAAAGASQALAPTCAAAAILALVAWRGRAALLAVFLAGAALCAAEERALDAARRAPDVDDRDVDRVVGTVDGPVEATPKRIRTVLRAGSRRLLVSLPRGARVLPGDRIAVVGYLRSPRGYVVPGAFDRRHYVAARGAELELAARQWALVESGARWHWLRPAAAMHRWASERINARGGDEQGRSALAAVVAGHRGGGGEDVYRDAGIGHVLAVSGLHLGAVAAIAFVIACWLWAALGIRRIPPRHIAAICALAASVAYAAVTGLRPSTIRALAVATFVLLGIASDRRADPLAALSLAAILMLAHRPSTLWDPGAQLSFAATATLIAVFRGRSPGRGTLAYLAAMVRASLWTALATAPIAALAFHRATPSGLVGNLFAIPIVEFVALPLGLLGTLVSAVSERGGGLVLDVAIAALSVVARLADALRTAVPPIAVAPPSSLELLLFAPAFAFAATRRRRPMAAFAVAIALALPLTVRHLSGADRNELRIAFVDVGQGDAAVVEFPRGEVWLVDAGGLPFVARDKSGASGAHPGSHAVLPYLRHRRIDRVDVAVISHAHPDHYRGLWGLYGAVEVDEVWLARSHGERGRPAELSALLRLLRLGGTRVVHPRLGTTARSGAQVTVLAPAYDGTVAADDPVLESNDNSLVVRLAYAGRSLLFTGDIEEEGEADLADSLGPADVVKVPHHGSRTSSTEVFVHQLKPELAIISCGVRNRFGFPDAQVLVRWLDAGARVLRTDVHGTVEVRISERGHLSADVMLPDP